MNMNLAEYKKVNKISGKDLVEAVAVFLVRDGEVLLGKRKTKIGNGLYVGIGGKLERDESLEECCVREVKEEIGVDLKVKDLVKVASLDFYFKEKLSWNMRGYIYVCREWEGVESESEEIVPRWFSIDQIPFERMWDDSRYYLPDILLGKKFEAEFLYEGMKVVEVKLRVRK